MNVNRLFFGAAAALMLSSTPSFAGDPNIDRHFWHDRPRVQIIDNSALVNDVRHPGNVPQTYVIEMPQQAQPAAPPLMIRPGMNQQPGVTFVHSGLPDAGFQSAINPGNQARLANNLPNGMSTNMLAGKMLSKPAVPVAAKPAASTTAPKATLLQSAPKTLVYSSQPSTSGMSGTNVKTSVVGSVQRGSLLAAQAHH
ncbi:MAG: hypothetical protein JST89_19200 [Cyanobacteria bacterium SZAS-4]|nr:hypothetical protein [Cyanobacteria bacterium SZAS-4]